MSAQNCPISSNDFEIKEAEFVQNFAYILCNNQVLKNLIFESKKKIQKELFDNPQLLILINSFYDLMSISNFGEMKWTATLTDLAKSYSIVKGQIKENNPELKTANFDSSFVISFILDYIQEFLNEINKNQIFEYKEDGFLKANKLNLFDFFRVTICSENLYSKQWFISLKLRKNGQSKVLYQISISVCFI